MYKNVFSQLSESQKENLAHSKKREEQQEVSRLLRLRNDKTNADEAVIWVTVILYSITALVIYLGFLYYQKTFSEMLNPQMATLFALLLPTIVEIGKIKLIGKFLRALSFGWIGRTIHWSQVVYWLFVGAIGAASFWWSYSISTGGIKEVAKENAEIKNQQQAFVATLSAATADIDAQIRSIEQSTESAGEMKTKSGHTNWATQPIHANNAQSLKSLYAQKESVTNVVTKEYEEKAGNIKLKVSAWANFIERFGGWGEWAGLFCLLAICFFQRSLYEKNKEMVMAQENEGKNQSPPLSFSAQNINGQTHPIHNKAPQRFYFNRESIGGNVVVTPTPTNDLSRQPLFPTDTENTVSQFQPTVSQQNGTDMTNQADAVLKLAEKELRGWVANFGRKDGKDSNVSSNVNRILTRTANDVRQKGFHPTREVWLKFYTYIQGDLFPLLNLKGWPYEFERQFVADVYRIRPEEVEVPA